MRAPSPSQLTPETVGAPTRALASRSTHLAAAPRASSTNGGLHTNRDFLKLWSGETVSLFGSQVTALALPLVAVVSLHASAASIGVLNALRFAPFALITVFAGVLVDRVRRRPILIATNLGRALLISTIPAAAALGALRIQVLFVVAFLVGLLTVFFDLAYQAYLPSLVTRRTLTDANGRLQASASAAEIGGPGLGGLLVQALTAPYALIVDAASFLISSASVATIKHPEQRVRDATPVPMLVAIRAGARFTFTNPYLRAIAAEAACFNLCEQAILTVFVVYAIRELGFTPGLLGLVLSTGAVGALAGSLAAGRLARRYGLGATILASMALACLVPILIPAIGDHGRTTALPLAGVFLAWGTAVAVSNVLVITLRQTITPERLLGRMNAAYRTLTYGAIPLGALLGGTLASPIGLRTTLLAAALGLLAALSVVVLSPIRQLESLPEIPFSPVRSDCLNRRRETKVMDIGPALSEQAGVSHPDSGGSR